MESGVLAGEQPRHAHSHKRRVRGFLSTRYLSDIYLSPLPFRPLRPLEKAHLPQEEE